MISHNAAKRLLDALTGDPDTVAALSSYIEHQASLERLDNPSVARLANAAERRSCEAIARVKTLTDDLGKAQAEIAALRGAQADLSEVLCELLAMIEVN